MTITISKQLLNGKQSPPAPAVETSKSDKVPKKSKGDGKKKRHEKEKRKEETKTKKKPSKKGMKELPFPNCMDLSLRDIAPSFVDFSVQDTENKKYGPARLQSEVVRKAEDHFIHQK